MIRRPFVGYKPACYRCKHIFMLNYRPILMTVIFVRELSRRIQIAALVFGNSFSYEFHSLRIGIPDRL